MSDDIESTEEYWRETQPDLMNLIDRSNEVVDNDEWVWSREDDGRDTVTTVFGVTMDEGDKTYLIPTLWDGKRLEGDEAWKRAWDYADEKGIKWPSFNSPDEANEVYSKVKQFMRYPSKEALARKPKDVTGY